MRTAWSRGWLGGLTGGGNGTKTRTDAGMCALRTAKKCGVSAWPFKHPYLCTKCARKSVFGYPGSIPAGSRSTSASDGPRRAAPRWVGRGPGTSHGARRAGGGLLQLHAGATASGAAVLGFKAIWVQGTKGRATPRASVSGPRSAHPLDQGRAMHVAGEVRPC